MRRRTRHHLLALAALCLSATASHAQLAEFNAVNAAAREARQRGDQVALLANTRKLAGFIPGHPSTQVTLARALASTGDRAGAIAQLERVAELGIPLDISTDAAFADLKDDPGFLAAQQRLAANNKGLGRSKDIIKLGLTAGSEGVAWSERSRSFLMGSGGSVHAFRLDGGGPARPVARALGPQILGIRPDPASGSYLVCVNEPDGSHSAVVRHLEASGAVIGIYRLPTPNALCNDIALLKDGGFAVTDSNNGAVFHLVRGKLEPLALTSPVYFPNGIASDLGNDRLYVAHAGGIVVHDLRRGSSHELTAAGTLIGGVDGMVLHEGALIAVQNPIAPGVAPRLLRIAPDASARTATVDVLLAGADFPGGASTVAVVGNEAFIMARPPGGNEQRGDPYLIRVPL